MTTPKVKKAPKVKVAETVEDLLAEIREAASGGNYIFRGENKNHKEICSKLYRDYQAKKDAEHFDIKAVEGEIVGEVRKHTHEKGGKDAILEQLQHYGGKTNQIDFSADYLIALFFACDGNHREKGRLILLKAKAKKNIEIYKPTSPQNRAIAQKSIFVSSSTGIVEVKPDDIVTVPKKLKIDVLEYLNKYHNISTATIYNDIHGYIYQTTIHKIAYKHFYLGHAHQSKGNDDKAIDEYTKAINKKPNLAEAYNNRGNVHNNKGEHDLAIKDYDKAINFNPNDARLYSNRGDAYNSKGEHDTAIANCDKAIELNPDLAEAYYNRCNAYNSKGEYALAFTDYKKAVELNPNYAQGDKTATEMITAAKPGITLPLPTTTKPFI